jgi:RNA polymerase sigma-70 factor (ECF subfamily)
VTGADDGIAADRRVAERVRRGDVEAFAGLVEAHQGAVRGWLRRLVGDPDTADDLAQDTFLRAFERLDAWDGRGSFRAWLFGIARHLALAGHRRAGRESRALETAHRGVAEVRTPLPEVHDLEGLLATLGEVERECLVLHLGWGLTHGEIGAMLELPTGTVKSHVHRARRRIGAALQESGA